MKGNNLLHTHSGYAHHYIDTSFIGKLKREDNSSAISKMKDKEQQLYNRFDANNFTEFREQLLNLFLPQDLEVIRRFEAENLEKVLKQFSLQQHELYGQEVELRFDFSQLEKLHLEEKLMGFNKNERSKNDSVHIRYDVKGIKDIINKQFGRRFHTGSDFEKNVDIAVHQLLTSKVLEIGLGKLNSAGQYDYSEIYKIHEIPNFPWGVTKDIYQSAIKENNTIILTEIDNAIKKIYAFLQNTLGANASPELKQAIRQAWIKLCRDGNDPALFFSGGKTQSFISGVQGALGEFQTALIFEYIGIKAGMNTLASIKGSTRLMDTLSKEQARTDVQIFESVGLQVKNFITIQKTIDGKAQTSFLHDIYTRIHPKKLAEYFDSDIRDNFLGFMANFYFNKTYYSDEFSHMWELRTNLENWLGEIMNMAIQDAVGDTVTFYVIGGRYMVPCSAILAAAEQLNLKGSLVIRSSYEGKTNSEFAQYDEKGKAEYEKYWTKERGYWEPVISEQNKTFENLINHSISIQTNFNFFEAIKDYALW